jgi:hypothetical protein
MMPSAVISGTWRSRPGVGLRFAMRLTRRTLLQRAGLAVSLALVFGVTLRPVGGPNHIALAPWAPQQLDAVNLVGNVALFALPAAVLWSFDWSLLRTLVAGFALSLGIELLQLAIPGRTTATADVLCNTLGAVVGWLVAASLRSPQVKV